VSDNQPGAPEARGDLQAEAEIVPMSAFLEDVPPGETRQVRPVVYRSNSGTGPTSTLYMPELHLHCSNERCNGLRVFRKEGRSSHLVEDDTTEVFVKFMCSNCRRNSKTYALAVHWKAGDFQGEVLKYGENPPFGPPTPARLISLIGPARDLFLKGRRSENQGLGIGAFSYYRRVIEGQKNHLLENIASAAERLNAPAAMIERLREVQREAQFSRAIDAVKDAIPESLKIREHNPLTLLHRALSEGLHEGSDEECLERAHTIRLVLTDLAERIAQALKDDRELNQAVGRLTQRLDRKPGQGSS